MPLPPRAAAAAFLAGALFAPAPCAGGVKPLGALPEGDAIEWGALQVRPSVELHYGYDSNLLFTSRDIEEASGGVRGVFRDQFLAVEPRLGVRLPFSQSYLEVTYRPSFVSYRDLALAEELSHGADAELDLRTGGGGQVSVAGAWDRGLFEVETLEGGGETTFDAERFRRLDGRVRYRRGAGRPFGLDVGVGVTDFTFDEAGERGLADYEVVRFGADVLHRPTTALELQFVTEGSFTDRARVASTSAVKALDVYGAGFGARWIPRAEIVISGRAIVTRLEGSFFPTEESAARAASGSALTALKADLAWQQQTGARSSLAVRLRHRPVQSFFYNNDHYLSTVASGSFDFTFGRGLSLTINGSYGQNRYAARLDDSIIDTGSLYAGGPGDRDPFGVVGVRRIDALVAGEAVLELPLTRRVSLALGLGTAARRSNVALVDYEQTRVFTRVSAGWR